MVIEEPGSSWTKECWEDFPGRFTSRMSYVEVRAALASALRSGRMSDGEHATAKAQFDQYWQRLEVIEPSIELVDSAGELSESLGLRGYDAVQLVSAISAWSKAKGVYMLTWDNDLARASYDSGISVIRTTDA